MPWFNVDFWEILGADQQHADGISIFSQIKDLPYQQRLAERGDEHADYIEVSSISNGEVFGNGEQVRKTGLPGRFNLQTGAKHELDLAEQEGLNEAAYFVYDTGLKVLALQRHKLFRASSLERIMAEVAGTQFYFNPKLRKDKWDRFNKMDRIGSVNLRLRNPSHHPDFSKTIPSFGAMLEDAQEEAGAWEVELIMSMGRSRKSMNPGLIRRIVRSIRGQDDNIEKLKVKGRIADTGKTEEIDFIRDRLVFSAQVEYSSRTLDPKRCQHTLRQAIETHRPYLKSLL